MNETNTEKFVFKTGLNEPFITHKIFHEFTYENGPFYQRGGHTQTERQKKKSL